MTRHDLLRLETLLIQFLFEMPKSKNKSKSRPSADAARLLLQEIRQRKTKQKAG